jgi:hypothetical protein
MRSKKAVVKVNDRTVRYESKAEKRGKVIRVKDGQLLKYERFTKLSDKRVVVPMVRLSMEVLSPAVPGVTCIAQVVTHDVPARHFREALTVGMLVECIPVI